MKKEICSVMVVAWLGIALAFLAIAGEAATPRQRISSAKNTQDAPITVALTRAAEFYEIFDLPILVQQIYSRQGTPMIILWEAEAHAEMTRQRKTGASDWEIDVAFPRQDSRGGGSGQPVVVTKNLPRRGPPPTAAPASPKAAQAVVVAARHLWKGWEKTGASLFEPVIVDVGLTDDGEWIVGFTYLPYRFGIEASVLVSQDLKPLRVLGGL